MIDKDNSDTETGLKPCSYCGTLIKTQYDDDICSKCFTNDEDDSFEEECDD